MSSPGSTVKKRPIPPIRSKQRRLCVVQSPDLNAVGREIDFEHGLLFGRSAGGPGRLDDETASREHARIIEQDGAWMIEDLQSGNGTFVDGTRVDHATRLNDDSVVLIGDTLLVVDSDPGPDALPVANNADGSQVSGIAGVSMAASRLRRSIATAARSGGTVLLIGATGSGKEVAARALHHLGGRSGAYVPVNCAALPESLADAELFGHRRGAFTGAVEDRDGYFVHADGGTLFLDEITDLSLPLQAKLLRVLEDRALQPLGGGPPRMLDLRVIAAAQHELEGSSFREDLLARLADWVLRIPPLAHRRADILILFDHFERLASTQPGSGPRPRSAEFAEALLLHPWPMNIRELEKLTRRLAMLTEPDELLELVDLPEALQDRVRARTITAPTPAPGPTLADQAIPYRSDLPEREELETILRATSGNILRTAERLYRKRTQIYRAIERYGLDLQLYRGTN